MRHGRPAGRRAARGRPRLILDAALQVGLHLADGGRAATFFIRRELGDLFLDQLALFGGQSIVDVLFFAAVFSVLIVVVITAAFGLGIGIFFFTVFIIGAALVIVGAALVEVWLWVLELLYPSLYGLQGWTLTSCKLMLAFVAIATVAVAVIVVTGGRHVADLFVMTMTALL